VKTITIRDDVYNRLAMLKTEGESFSDVIDRLLRHEKFNLNEYFGCLRDSVVLDEVAEYSKRFREATKLRT
jgi:predicted CopG family antitoxin